ncbi:RNase P and RNase MRP subunit Pop8 [Schizosaccharomyces cryophilus OY26]|uniref:RNase P and RNase MRP subunit Pop8 n=1 Tax=Schizosaccharomyces cryophilus (strain OY26 / ATCC MYA-4695 / CBS 11777 / NBRC 106824 / NRRL Y48691) TaxID=653667 RepID=S9VN76_SCHCR|nr:RNase P and RNase MRP subunit Pop8 [Schizosaccharomyces cryophilus OY26]EPY49388.1 RNase P and RNase MRP subunit Pop8 [Schizosaccharomyces cryophilus OY26]
MVLHQRIKSENYYILVKILQNSSMEIELEELTLRHFITLALSQSFGIFGSAISVDIIHRDASLLYLRCHINDSEKLLLALGSYIREPEQVRFQVLHASNFLFKIGPKPISFY